MIDSHAHIHDPKFDADREAVLVRAREVGVEKILTIGTSVKESRDAVEITKQYPDMMRATVAVHPHEYSKLPDESTQREWKSAIAEMAREISVVGIGECGLDFHAFGGVEVTEEQRTCQRAGFLDHIQIAQEVKKPIVIHARESYEDVKCQIENINKTEREKIPWIILHCYQGDVGVTKQFLELSKNIVFSFAGNVTYPVKKPVVGTIDDPREVLATIPLERMLVETDCPYLAPQIYRGKRNEPAYVVETARFIADTRGVSLDTFDHIITRNTKNIFW